MSLYYIAGPTGISDIRVRRMIAFPRCPAAQPYLLFHHSLAPSIELTLNKTHQTILPRIQNQNFMTKNMVSRTFTFAAQSSLYCFSYSPKVNSSKISIKQPRARFLNEHRSLKFSHPSRVPWLPEPKLKQRKSRSVCCFNAGDKSKDGLQGKETRLDWPILERWEVPWGWQTASLTSFACGISFVLTGLVEAAAIPYLGLRIEELSLDEKAEILFIDQGITTAVVLGVLYGVANSFQPLPEDIYRYDLREPFSLRKGWLLWAGIGLVGAVAAISLTGVAVSFFSGESPQRETDALVRLLPLIGSSSISTACLVGITGVLAPILEESVFRGVPTPVAVIISAAVFALAHLTPGEFPQLFVLGAAMGFSYAQTRNLLTPITIHAFWNSGVILLLTFLQLQGYDIKELLQAT
ncbi:CAAX amino terminal protease [Trema orientale]|uniref:CAAX amino terminal protease n=1 Tax=Trema orientale TaxID=63057 RepID=A0A2P5D1A7_TREOI|nr:CAAX amino terminal protease [Trema orientale]